MKTEKDLFEGHYIAVEHHCEGEGVDFVETITLEELEKICEIIGSDDLIEDISLKHGIRIFLQTPEQHRESCIQGLMFADGVCRKIAEKTVDGIKMTEEEYEKLEAEHEAAQLSEQ